MIKKTVLLMFLICAIPHSFAQLKSVQFEQIDNLQIREKRNVIVFIHTDWCQYCKAMLAKTFKNQAVENLINKNFYFIDFNAEEQRNIAFNNTDFVFKPNGNNSGVHELAIALGTINKQISYPVLCVLNEKNEIIYQHNSFLNAKDLLQILNQVMLLKN